MDKILFIDFQNHLYRANVGFGPKKHITHIECGSATDVMWGSDANPGHCECGGKWINGKCDKEIDDSFIVIFNFFRNLRPLIELFSPDKCFCVLEGHPQFRYDILSEYKANRIVKEGAKKELKSKLLQCGEEVIKLMKHLPVTVVRAANYEADDTVGTLCENMKDEDLTVMSGDSDYIQLLQRGYGHIKLYHPIKKEFIQAPDYPYVAWKCLNGDKTDNIPSILSPAKALACIKDAAKFKDFLAIEENRANFNINMKLIQFHTVPEEEIIFHEGIRNFPKLKEEFTKMKFQSIVNDASWKKYVKTFDCLKY
jgi:5'-3' exonuclease